MIHRPGARSDSSGELFEDDATLSGVVPSADPSSVDPTLTAVEMQAGNEWSCPGLVDGELLRCPPVGWTPLAHAPPRLVDPMGGPMCGIPT